MKLQKAKTFTEISMLEQHRISQLHGTFYWFGEVLATNLSGTRSLFGSFATLFLVFSTGMFYTMPQIQDTDKCLR
jgi:hypothetical protein